MKGQGTSGNDEPTNSSSAEAPRPSESNTKPTKHSDATPAREAGTEKPSEAQLNGTKSALKEGPSALASTQKVFSVADLRNLARRPG